MKKKIFFFVYAFLFCASFFAQALENQIEIEPVKIKEIDSDKAAVEFKTDVSEVEVYLNGSFYGFTNLEVTDLLPGDYKVDLVLKGYEKQSFVIHAKKSLSQTYYVEMKLIQGTITLFNLPQGAEISIDEKIYNSNYKKNDSNVFYVIPGFHAVKIRCFGYSIFEEEVQVQGYADCSLKPEMSFADFEVTDFKAAKEAFNPDYKGKLGSCIFNFNVTSNQPVLAEIFDSENKIVWTKTLGDFDSWSQSFAWNGKNQDGQTLEDGTYVAKLFYGRDNESELSTQVCVSRDIDYLPAFGSKNDGFQLSFNVFPLVKITMTDSKTAFTGLGLSAGAVWDFKEHFELKGSASTLSCYSDGFAGKINANFTAYNSFELKNKLDFCYGGLVRLGFSTQNIYDSCPVDSGNGLGAGGLLGLSCKKWSAVYSCQFIYSAATGSFSQNDLLLSNTINGSFKPINNFSLNSWIGLNTSFNSKTTENGTEIGLNYGAGVNWLPFSSAILVNFNLDGNLVFDNANYISLLIGLSYLF